MGLLHPAIYALAPLVITDLPREYDAFKRFLELTGEIDDDYWCHDNINECIEEEGDSYFCIPKDWGAESYFRYHEGYYPDDVSDYPHYTAAEIMAKLTTIYRRS